MKNRKKHGFSAYINKYSKFWNISSEFILEVWICIKHSQKMYLLLIYQNCMNRMLLEKTQKIQPFPIIFLLCRSQLPFRTNALQVMTQFPPSLKNYLKNDIFGFTQLDWAQLCATQHDSVQLSATQFNSARLRKSSES